MMIDLIYNPAKQSTIQSLGKRVSNITCLSHVSLTLNLFAPRYLHVRHEAIVQLTQVQIQQVANFSNSIQIISNQFYLRKFIIRQYLVQKYSNCEPQQHRRRFCCEKKCRQWTICSTESLKHSLCPVRAKVKLISIRKNFPIYAIPRLRNQ